MSKHFDKILDFSDRLELAVIHQDSEEELIVVSNEEKGIYRMVIDCEYPILIFEQLIYEINSQSTEHFLELLK